MSESSRCEVAECGATVEDTVFDKYFKKRVCNGCWEKNFRAAEANGYAEWWEANFKVTEEPAPGFWKRMGAFQDLSHINPSAYGPKR